MKATMRYFSIITILFSFAGVANALQYTSPFPPRDNGCSHLPNAQTSLDESQDLMRSDLQVMKSNTCIEDSGLQAAQNDIDSRLLDLSTIRNCVNLNPHDEQVITHAINDLVRVRSQFYDYMLDLRLNHKCGY